MGNNSDHHENSPSKFPQYEKCLHFESSEAGESAIRGTLQHKWLEISLNSTDKENGALEIDKADLDWCHDNLTKYEVNCVDWAYYKILSLMSKHKASLLSLKAERKVVVFTSDFTSTEGTVDVTFTGSVPLYEDLVIADYKSGKVRDYSGQMKVYMLGVAQENGLLGDTPVYGYTVYGKEREVTEYKYTVEELQEYFDSMYSKIEAKESTDPVVNEYCSWCSKKSKCKARNEAVKSFTKDVPEATNIPITLKTNLATMTGEKLGKMLEFAKVVKGWCVDVEEEVKSRFNSGKTVEGWELKKSSTKGFPDSTAVFAKITDLGEETALRFVEQLSISQKLVKEVVGNEIFKESFVGMLEVTGSKKTLVKSGEKEDENE